MATALRTQLRTQEMKGNSYWRGSSDWALIQYCYSQLPRLSTHVHRSNSWAAIASKAAFLARALKFEECHAAQNLAAA